MMENNKNLVQAKDGYKSRIANIKIAIAADNMPKLFKDEFTRVIEKMEFAVQTNKFNELEKLEKQLSSIAEKYKNDN